METLNITAYTEDHNQINAIKAFMESLNIKFKIDNKESNYNPEFVEKILNSKQDHKDGKGEVLTLDEFKKLCK
ncbi:MAG: hypothetical protein H6604_08840 [Flavobacteriales bacterium]|nr:hypothetical protein [Flavobacteriales bacterium]